MSHLRHIVRGARINVYIQRLGAGTALQELNLRFVYFLGTVILPYRIYKRHVHLFSRTIRICNIFSRTLTTEIAISLSLQIYII